MQQDDDRAVQEGAAILATCIVQTLEEMHPGYQERFLEKLTAAQYYLRDEHTLPSQKSREMLDWTRELLTGFTWGKGQGKPFLSE